MQKREFVTELWEGVYLMYRILESPHLQIEEISENLWAIPNPGGGPISKLFVDWEWLVGFYGISTTMI